MSVKLVKQPRRKTYDIRIWLKKYQRIHWVNTYCTNERDAKKVLAKYVKADIEHGLGLRENQLPTSPPPSLGEAIDKYLNAVDKNPDMSVDTYKLHKSVMNTFAEVMGRSVMIDQLGIRESDHYADYLNTTERRSGAFKGKKGLSENAQNIRKRIVTTFFNWCIKERKWIDSTNFKLVKTSPPSMPKLITPMQFDLLLTNEPNEYLRSYYKLGWYSGLRRKECNPSELFTDRKTGQLCLLVSITKGRETRERSVPLPKENKVDWMKVQKAQYSLDYISRGFKRACKRAGFYVPYKTTFHTLRHSYATLQCVEGTHLVVLAKYMGHTTTKTTEKYADAEARMFALLDQETGKYVA